MNFNYSQPSFYHFSEDSTELAKFVLSEHVFKDSILLDALSGCGIIGIEVVLEAREKIKELYFIDKNPSWRVYIESNMASFLPDRDYHVFYEDYLNWKSQKKFSLIVSNPPYYFSEQFRQSPDHERRMARSWRVADAQAFLQVSKSLLTAQGELYLVLPQKVLNCYSFEQAGLQVVKSKVINGGKVFLRCHHL